MISSDWSTPELFSLMASELANLIIGYADRSDAGQK
jgi:hypothetical protein